MAGVIPVREFKTADEMRAHAAALIRKTFAPRAPSVPAQASPVDLYREVMQIAPPVREITRAAYLEAMAEIRASEHSVKSLIRIAAAVSGHTASEIMSPQQNYSITKARHISIFIAARSLGLSLHQIGRHYGDRDHTSILNAKKRVAAVCVAHGIGWSDDAVEMTQRLWDADWRARKAA